MLCSRLKKKKQRRTTKRCRGSSQFPARPITSNPFIVALPINFRLPPSSSSLHHHHQPSSPTSSRPRHECGRLVLPAQLHTHQKTAWLARPAASTVAFRPFLLLTDLRAGYLISGAWKKHKITSPITIQWPAQSKNGRSIDEQLRRWCGVGVHPRCLPDRF